MMLAPWFLSIQCIERQSIVNLKIHWANLKPPLAPSDEDRLLFKNHLSEGTTLLLGSTKLLLDLCDQALDIDPIYLDQKIIKGNWIKNDRFFNNMIGDGVLNFNPILTEKILDMASKNSHQFLVRAFNFKLDSMRVADYFPQQNDFKIKPEVIFRNNIYSFYKWTFN
jgi:hypothetical protein